MQVTTDAPRTLGTRQWLAVVRLLVALAAVTNTVGQPLQGLDGLVAVAACLATVVTVLRPVAGFWCCLVVVGVATVTGNLNGIGLMVCLATATTTALFAARPAILAVLALTAPLAVGRWHDAGPQGLAFQLALTLVFAALGLVFRPLLGRLDGERRAIRAVEATVADLRRREREQLAHELGDLLLEGFGATRRRLDALGRTSDPEVLRAGLREVGQDVRAALSSLRGLVATLRDEDEGSAGLLAAALDEAEDLLVCHGFVVQRDGGLPEALAEEGIQTVLSALQEVAGRVLEQGDPSAGVTLEVLAPPRGPAVRVAWTGVADGGACEVRLALPVPAVPTEALVAGGAARPRRRARTLPLTACLLGLVLTAWSLPGEERWAHGWAALLAPGALVCAAICLWRPWAGTIGLLAVIAGVAETAPAWTPTIPVALLVAGPVLFAVLAATERSRRRTATAAVAVALVAACCRTHDPAALPLLGPVLALWCLAPGLALRAVRSTAQAQARRLAAAERERRDARAQERRRLARELHDAGAHDLSVLLAELAACSSRPTPERLQALVTSADRRIARVQEDLAVLTGLIAAQPGDDDPLGLPSATLEAMAARLVEHGHHPVVDVDGPVDAVAATGRRTIGRALREGTTNMLRHAPAGSTCSISLTATPSRLVLRMTSPMPAVPMVSPWSSGWGLKGLAERVELTGGSFTAGEHDGSWVVLVGLPRQDGAAARQLAPGRRAVSPAVAVPWGRRSRAGSSAPAAGSAS